MSGNENRGTNSKRTWNPLFSSLLCHASMMHDTAAAHLRSKLCMAAVQSDTNHVLSSDYSEIKIIGAGADAVDFALINLCHKGDIVVTQDYGVAAMALGKGAYAIHQSGRWYTNENIDRLLMERHMAKKARMGKGKHHLKGPAKRTQEDDDRFRNRLKSWWRWLVARNRIKWRQVIHNRI